MSGCAQEDTDSAHEKGCVTRRAMGLVGVGMVVASRLTSWWSSPSITTSAASAAESSSVKEERRPSPCHTLKRREASRYSSVYAVPSDVARPAACLAAMDCAVGRSAAASASEGGLDRRWAARKPAAAAAAAGASLARRIVKSQRCQVGANAARRGGGRAGLPPQSLLSIRPAPQYIPTSEESKTTGGQVPSSRGGRGLAGTG